MNRMAFAIAALSTTFALSACETDPPKQGEGDDPVVCADDAAVYDRVIHDAILQSTCIRCHVGGGLADGSRLVLEASLGSALEDGDALGA